MYADADKPGGLIEFFAILAVVVITKWLSEIPLRIRSSVWWTQEKK